MPTDHPDTTTPSDQPPEDKKECHEEVPSYGEAPSYDPSKENYAGISSVSISSVGIENTEDLCAARDFAEMIVDTVREGLLVLDFDLRVQAANESFYNTFEVRPEETLGRLVYELGNGQWSIPELHELLEGILPEKKVMGDYEVEHAFENIGRRMMLLNARQLDDHQLILLAIEDVTEQRKHMESLREGEQRQAFLLALSDRLRSLSDPVAVIMAAAELFGQHLGAAGAGYNLVDAEIRIAQVNPVARPVFGGIPDLIGRDFDEVIHVLWEKNYAGEVVRYFRHTLETGESYYTPERAEYRADRGITEYYEWCIDRTPLPDGRYGVVCYFRDISDQVRARQAIAESEARFRAVADLVPDLLWRADAFGERTWGNQRWMEYTGQTLVEAVGYGWIDTIHPDDRGRALHTYWEAIGTGEPFRHEHRIRRADTDFLRKDAAFGDREALSEETAKLHDLLGGAIETTRQLTMDLSPPVLKGEGLVDALSWLVAHMKDLYGLEVELEAAHAFYIPDEDLRVLLFQIVRELLFNVAKHAGIDHATVALHDGEEDKHLVIEVADQGLGFDVAAAEGDREGGFGLFSVRERLDLFGGRMEIDSAPGEGTRVVVHAPVAPKRPPEKAARSDPDAGPS